MQKDTLILRLIRVRGSFQCIGNDTDSETLYLSITNYDTANIGVKIDSTHAKGYFIFDTNNV